MDRSRNRRIYLTGFMGSGKTTLGPILANTLGFSFLDIDRAIEQNTGKSIPEIFRESDEQRFRQLERSILETVSRYNNYVIALGGGTITNHHNLELVKSSGILIYLKSTVSEIIRRLRYKTDRPLFTILRQRADTNEDLRGLVTSLLQQRELFYNQADIIISTVRYPVGKTIDEIIHHLHSYHKSSDQHDDKNSN
jgi:shikimate kinase